MYTGHVREIGTVVAADETRIAVSAPRSAEGGPDAGCLIGGGRTVRPAPEEPHALRANLSADTRRRSTLDELRPGARVNVETRLVVGDPLAGHLVQGNVDAVGKVVRARDEVGGRRLWS